jgi:TonB family protein
VASATSASRNPEAAPRAASAAPAAQAAADITVITTRDDFLLELGQILGGQAAVHPVDSLDAAVEALRSSKRTQLLIIDSHDIPNVRATVDSVHAAAPRVPVLVFAPSATERQLGAALKGSKVFAVLPTPLEPKKTQAVLGGALAEAAASHAVATAAPAAAELASIGAFRPQSTAQQVPADVGKGGTRLVLVAVAVALALIAAGVFWYFQGRSAPAGTAAPQAVKAPVGVPGAAPGDAGTAAADTASAAPVADTSILQGKVDDLLEKARAAMHERRFTEPAGDNALLYYRSALAADPDNAEGRDGLLRVAGALASRFEEALSAGRFDEAAATLANFKVAAPADARIGTFEQRLYSGAISRALADGNPERAAQYLRQAQQSNAISAEQIGKWRADLARRQQDDVKVQRLAELVEDRLRAGRLVEADDSARSYLLQLQALSPANASTQRLAHELGAACVRKAREAALARNTAEEDRWLDEARSLGMTSADIVAFENEVSSARQKVAQAESDRIAQLVRDRLHDGRLTDPAQDSAAWYLGQLQASDPANANVPAESQELAGRLLERARAAILAGRAGDADLAQARRWGADPRDVLAVQQLQAQARSAAAAAPPVDPASLASKLQRVHGAPPDYPASALAKNITGSVTLRFTVDTRGEPRDIQVLEAAPPGVFDQAAINAVKRWRYTPMVVNGTAVEVPVSTRVRFELPKN